MIRNSFHAVSATIGALAILALSSGTAQASTPQVSPPATTQDDAVIAEQVYNALDADPVHYFRHVDVQVQHGVVTLSGYVWSTSSVYRAERIAANTPGVTHVIDRMELDRNGVAPHA